MFGDVRFVCMGGTPQRMKSFAEYMLDQLDIQLPTGTYVIKSDKLLEKYAKFCSSSFRKFLFWINFSTISDQRLLGAKM